MIRFSKLTGTVLAALLGSHIALADSGYYTWDDNQGFQSAQKCSVVETDDLPLFVVDSTSTSARQVHLAKSSPTIPNRSMIRVYGDRISKTKVQVIGLSSSAAGLLGSMGTMSSTAIKELSGYVIELQAGSPASTYGDSGIPVANSFLEVEMKDGSYLVSHCGSGDSAKGYMLFNVFTSDSKDPVAEIGILAASTKILSSSNAFTTSEAETAISQSSSSSSPGRSTTPPSSLSINTSSPDNSATDQNQNISTSQVSTNENSSQPSSPSHSAGPQYAICTPHGLPTPMLDTSLNDIVGQANDGELVQAISSATKTVNSHGKRTTFINVQLQDRSGSGWVDKSTYMLAIYCSQELSTAAPSKPIQLKPVVPTPKPAPAPAPAPVTDGSSVTPGKAMNCAEETIISHAKTTEYADYKNAPESAGTCALGVRRELQASGVGGITGGIGDAIDFLAQLPKYGFVKTNITDPNLAPAGAIIVFGGPNSQTYLNTGKEIDAAKGFSTMIGNWAGHVTIKGDDGWYYTDARTKEPAIGWLNGKNVDKERNVFGIFVPGPSLVQKYAGKCPGMSN